MSEKLDILTLPRQLSAAARRLVCGVRSVPDTLDKGLEVLSIHDPVGEAHGDDRQFYMLMAGIKPVDFQARPELPMQRSKE